MENQNKKKHAFWLSPETKQKIESQYRQDNCKSQSEFVENAVRFYSGYLATKDSGEYLAPILTQILRGTLDGFGAHISRNLFRLAVEEAKTWNLIAGAYNVTPETLQRIHTKSIGEVKRMNGRLTYEQVFANPPELVTEDAVEEDE